MSDAFEQVIEAVSKPLLAGEHVAAARIVASITPGATEKQADDQPLEFLHGLLQSCLRKGRKDLAAQMLWGPTLFTPKPHCTQLVWNALENSSSIIFLGAASLSKSYSAGVWLFLDWLLDPEFTAVRVVGPSEDHLKSNLFSHLVSLHQQASIPLPGEIGDLYIGLDRRSRKSSIQGVIIPLGKAGSGKLQGTKRVPRKTPHPVYGPLARLRIFMDEIEKIPRGVWKDVDNLAANLDPAGGFKIAGACNPEDVNGPVGQRTEPVDGWERGFDVDKSETWRSRRGWDVVRLDAMKCENVVEGRVIYPGLQTKQGLEQLILGSGGTNSPSYYTFARGCFPPEGTSFSIISQTQLNGIQGEWIYKDRPQKLMSVDVALEGNNAPKLMIGRFGLAVGLKHPVDHIHPTGREEIFSKPRWGLQVDQMFSLPKAETVLMAANIRTQGHQLGVDPGWVMLDRTGNGTGVHDLLKNTWSPEVRGLNYSEGPTKRKIFEEDTKRADEEYDRVCSEIWFALQRWLEFGMIKISPVVDTEKLFPQLTGRLYMPGKTRRVESKRDYKARGNDSPDEADTFTLLLHAARIASGVVPSMVTNPSSSTMSREAPVPFIIGCTDRCEHL